MEDVQVFSGQGRQHSNSVQPQSAADYRPSAHTTFKNWGGKPGTPIA